MKNQILCVLVLTLFRVTFSIAAEAPRVTDAPPVTPAREIDFTQVLKGPTGEDLTNCVKVDPVSKECMQKEPVTLGDASTIALEAMTDEDRNIDGKVKLDRDILARKVYKNAHAVLSPDDVALIKQRIGKVFGPTQVGAAWPLLDPTLNK